MFGRISALLLLGILTLSCQNEMQNIHNGIRDEMTKHPVSRLSDLYKYFFQDVYGPGHLIADPIAAGNFLDFELSEATAFESDDYQELLYKKNFIRVNLKVLAEKRVEREVFMKAFLESAEKFKTPDLDDWRQSWKKIEAEIQKLYPELPDYQRDKTSIDSLLDKGEYVMHHSRIYIETYDPHYRIIHRDLAGQLGLMKDL